MTAVPGGAKLRPGKRLARHGDGSLEQRSSAINMTARAGHAPVLGDFRLGVASLERKAESRSDHQPAHRIEDWDPSEDRPLPT